MQLWTGLRMAQVRTSRRAYQWSLRTSAGPGLIREKLWYGEGGMHELRTVKEPKQSLATVEETVELLMRVRLQILDVGLSLEPNLERTRSQRTATRRSTST